MAGSDADLPAADKRSRAVIVPHLTLVVGDTVMAGELEVTVLGPGRGRQALLAGWTDGNGDNIGTFFGDQMKR